MQRPEVHPDNHVALYDYYSQIQPSKRLIKTVIAASSLLYKPRLHFADGAEEEIAERKTENVRFIFGSNHSRLADQFAEFAAWKKSEALASEAERTFLIGKPSYATNVLTRRGFDAAGWVPAMRSQDFPAIPKVRAEASKSLINVCAGKIVNGWNMLIFTGGTRNTGDTNVAQKVHGGIGRIASAVTREGIDVSLIPVVPYWGDRENQSNNKPDIYVGKPIDGPFLTKSDATRPLQSALEEGMESVITINRRHNTL
jgi:1-acyl-sn-glycerol-3-phosphate acyltransferase